MSCHILNSLSMIITQLDKSKYTAHWCTALAGNAWSCAAKSKPPISIDKSPFVSQYTLATLSKFPSWHCCVLLQHQVKLWHLRILFSISSLSDTTTIPLHGHLATSQEGNLDKVASVYWLTKGDLSIEMGAYFWQHKTRHYLQGLCTNELCIWIHPTHNANCVMVPYPLPSDRKVDNEHFSLVTTSSTNFKPLSPIFLVRYR